MFQHFAALTLCSEIPQICLIHMEIKIQRFFFLYKPPLLFMKQTCHLSWLIKFNTKTLNDNDSRDNQTKEEWFYIIKLLSNHCYSCGGQFFIFCFHALVAGGIVQNFYPRETFTSASNAEENIKTKKKHESSGSSKLLVTVCLSQTNNLAISGPVY